MPIPWGGPMPVAGSGVAVRARNIIHDALRALGALRPGQQTSEDSYAEYLRWLNQLIDSWSTERLMLPVLDRETMSVSASTSTVEIDPSPLAAAGWLSDSSSEAPVRILTPDVWAEVGNKSTAGSVWGVYRAGDVLYLLQPPATSGTLALYQERFLESFPDLDTETSMRAGYARALTLGLAVEIAPAVEIHSKIPTSRLQLVMQRASDAKNAVKASNFRPSELAVDDALLGPGSFDIRTGRY